MKRSTKWLIAGALGSAALVVGLTVWAWLAERHAVARLLAVGASVAFESDARFNSLRGSYSYHSTDDRLPWPPWRQSDAEILANGYADPAGAVWDAHLPTDEAVARLLESPWAFRHVESLQLDNGVSEAAAAKLFAAAPSEFPELNGITCYARITSQETLDALLRLPLESFLIGCPQVEACDLGAIAQNKALKWLWINEGEYGCEDHGSQRYDENDFKTIVGHGSLKNLVLAGVDVSDAMADVLATATHFEALRISQASISEASITKLETSLPTTQLRISPRVDDPDIDEAE